MVGKLLEIYWPLDRAWYACRVLRYKPSSCKHQLLYIDDSVRETRTLSRELWRACTNPNRVCTCDSALFYVLYGYMLSMAFVVM